MLDLNLALLGLILSIVYSSSEISLLSANPLQLDVWEKQGKYFFDAVQQHQKNRRLLVQQLIWLKSPRASRKRTAI